MLGAVDDPRVRVLRGEGRGACAARNLALDVARGDVITYLDDDNRFDPHWLKAVVLAFRDRPEVGCAYGARVTDDGGRVVAAEATGRPWIHFSPWDPVGVRQGNLVDMNVLAHRRGDERFDEALAVCGDWDLLLQLVQDRDPVEIPAIGAYYRTDSPGRLTDDVPRDRQEADMDRVRANRSRTTAAESRARCSLPGMPSLPGAVHGVLRTVTRPLDAATRPIGSGQRYRPLYPLNVVDRVVNGDAHAREGGRRARRS